MDEQALDHLLDDVHRSFLTAGGAPSLSLAVGIGSEVVAQRAWGFADTERGVPATSDTAYLLASVTKPITATAVSLLAAQGALSLESPISAVLGYRLTQISPGPEPTVADLLAHRAGIGRYYRFFYADEPARPDPDFRVTAQRHAVVTTVPGRQYEYSNLGYGVLDHIIETATGEAASSYIMGSIFEPLAMASAWIGPTYEGGADSVAERYGTDGTAYPPYDVEHRGASLAWANAGDIVRFGLSHCDSSSFMRLPEIRRQHEPAVPGAAVGHAWRLTRPGAELVISHSGGMGGVASLLLVCPARGLAVAALVNESYSELPRQVAHAVMSAILSSTAGHRIDTLPAPTPDPVPRATTDAGQPVGLWAGETSTPPGTTSWRVELELRADGGASIGRGTTSAAASYLPPEGHDLRLAARWSPGAVTRPGDAVCLDLVRHGDDYRGRLAVTDPAGAGIAAVAADGGAPGSRVGDYVTYPLELIKQPTA